MKVDQLRHFRFEPDLAFQWNRTWANWDTSPSTA
jgi:hypothetical protein